MAHIYLMTRGIKHAVDRMMNELSAKYLPISYRPGLSIQVAVRPIQFWEIVFPEEHMDAMLYSLFDEGGGKTQHKKHQKMIWGLRKLLGKNVKPIPDYKRDPNKRILFYKEATEMIGVGIKKDHWIINDKKVENPTDEEKRIPGAQEGL